MVKIMVTPLTTGTEEIEDIIILITMITTGGMNLTGVLTPMVMEMDYGTLGGIVLRTDVQDGV
jgi:hypothetical protein